ncbi:hypothetical protein Pla52o_43410 [Novipirellula galeiformis]|uniref:Uncharacterized protein n=1 Tax=Novipirellula galeiformis TaxID=2528004 RepID=A0A5C6C744_9BACT|nr:hypothetical protein [Novipirellula galeiformis]TWU20463.1 hypothetical protein Pla52o_43410 [Novipirellula galeiformis]
MKAIANELLESSDDVTWLVCEQGNRWADAARRFAAEGLAEPWVPVVISCDAEELPNLLSGRLAGRHPKRTFRRRPPVIVLWELAPKSIAAKCRIITETRWAFPEVIQLAGITRIPSSLHPAISEFGIAIQLRNPESLQNVAARINRRCFAAPTRRD